MKLVLRRDVRTPSFTLGKLQCGKYELFTCEDAIREVKIPSITAIPFGIYKVIVSFSQRFQKHLPLLLDVPNFSGVRIHSGNTDKDTEGCILVGTTRGKGGVGNSRYAMSLVMDEFEKARIANDNVFIEIVS